ncbi:MAG: hypothetical protein EZS28_037165, partial [Streblomastix strix]
EFMDPIADQEEITDDQIVMINMIKEALQSGIYKDVSKLPPGVNYFHQLYLTPAQLEQEQQLMKEFGCDESRDNKHTIQELIQNNPQMFQLGKESQQQSIDQYSKDKQKSQILIKDHSTSALIREQPNVINEAKQTINEQTQIENKIQKQQKKRKGKRSRGFRHGALSKNISSDTESDVDSDSSYKQPSELSSDNSQKVMEKDKPEIINCNQKTLHQYVQSIHQGDYSSVPDSDNISFVGSFQFFAEKRFCYGPKKKIYEIITTLFPQIKFHLSTFYRKVELLKQPKNRTDICSICQAAEDLITELKTRGKTFEDLDKIADKDKIDLLLGFQEHSQHAKDQRSTMHSHIFNLAPGQAVCIGDYKEHIRVPQHRVQEGRNFYLELPVSYGGPHFHNTQLTNALVNKKMKFKPGVKFNVNYFVPQHGKNECDSVFGFLTSLLKRFKCGRLAKNAQKLVVSNFKQMLYFSLLDGELVTSTHSNPEKGERVLSPLRTKMGKVASELKISDVQRSGSQSLDDKVAGALHQLKSQKQKKN